MVNVAPNLEALQTCRNYSNWLVTELVNSVPALNSMLRKYHFEFTSYHKRRLHMGYPPISEENVWIRTPPIFLVIFDQLHYKERGESIYKTP